MLRKVFLLDIFGKSYDWTDKYIENCNAQAKDGWDWIIITDQQDIVGKGNVMVVNMTQDELQDKINNKLGLQVNLQGKRAKDGRAIGEFHPAFGVIFSDLIQGHDFWGYTNIDVVYGRLSKFCSDEFLGELDIFGNDPEQMNGIFSLLRNTEEANNIFRGVEGWQWKFNSNGYYAFDEIEITVPVIRARASGKLRVAFRTWRVGDRFDKDIHMPVPQIKLEPNGALIDTHKGEEIMMFHFGGCKRWCV